jgi:hypothetical protein
MLATRLSIMWFQNYSKEVGSEDEKNSLGLVCFVGNESRHGTDPSRDLVDPVPIPNPH